MIKDDIGGIIQSGVIFEGTYGIEIETECLDQYRFPKMAFWDDKEDGSLRFFGREYVLKVPLRYGEELDDAFTEFKNKTKKIEFVQDSNSTSVHVHINILPETWKTVGNFLTLYTLVENCLMEVSGEFRRNNLFCLPIRSVPHVKKIMNDLFMQVHQRKFQFGRLLEQEAIKYAALNLGTITRFGSLEIRSFRGETDVDIIHSWVSIFQKMMEYSRTDVSPCQIMDAYREKELDLLKEIFQDYYEQIVHEDMKKMIQPNLWYAGDFAYQFNDEQWRKLDEPREKPKDVLPKKPIDPDLEMRRLNKIAQDNFGDPYHDLDENERNVVDEMYMEQWAGNNNPVRDLDHIFEELRGDRGVNLGDPFPMPDFNEVRVAEIPVEPVLRRQR